MVLSNVLTAVFAFLCLAPPILSQQPSHLPLEEGRKWTLASSNGQVMSFEVVGRERNAYRVRWENPWNKTEFLMEPSGNKVILKGLDMGQGLANMPPNTVYFDFDQREGGQWSNALGRLGVQSRGKKLRTPAGVFDDVIEIKATDPKGFSTFFAFARDVGFVQFGAGGGAFLLRATSAGPRGSTTAPAPPRQAREGSARGEPGTIQASGSKTLVGLDSNPTPNEGYSNEANERRFKMSIDAGMSMTFLHPKWDELEPRAGHYTFEQVEFRMSLAEKYNVPVLLNLRIIDGNNRAIPSPYKNWNFDDSRLSAKLVELMRRFSPEFRRRVRWIAIGNEVDHYFESHRGDIQPYARLIARVLPTVRELFPGVPFTVNFSDQRLDDFDRLYRPILDQVDYFSFNYYPVNPDFTFRDPEGSRADLERMIASAGGRPVFFQELGYSSSPRLRSSEDKQARFVEVVFETVRKHPGKVLGINFNWMSDLPDSVVDQLGAYYKLNTDNFKQYIGTLGWFQKDGRPKKAWSVFQQIARQ